jgi:hypothetical protein
MNRILDRLGLVVALMLATLSARAAEPGALRASKAVVKAEVVAVIEGQLAAFRAGEVEKAYAHAAMSLQSQMPLPNFARLVRDGYPEIWKNQRAEFGLMRDDGRRATLTVRVFTTDGTSAAYDYVLFKEDDVWRIAGVLRHEARGEKGV